MVILSFDGVDDFANLTTHTSLFSGIHGPTSILVWFYPTDLTGTRTIFTDPCPELRMYTSNTAAYGAAYSNVSMGSVSVNNWYFGAVTHDHPMGLVGTVIKSYIDGNFVSQATRTVTENGYTNEEFGIGGKITGDSCSVPEVFKGYIDEVRIYNRALSAEEIKVIYEATK